MGARLSDGPVRWIVRFAAGGGTACFVLAQHPLLEREELGSNHAFESRELIGATDAAYGRAG